MKRQITKPLALTSLVVLAVGIAVCCMNRCGGDGDGTPIGDVGGQAQSPQAIGETKALSAKPSEFDPLQITNDLTTAGWDKGAAEAVVRLNSEWFGILADENPVALTTQVKLLKAIGQHHQLGGFLAKHPEAAGLLALADDPLPVMKSLNTAGRDYELVASLYVQHVSLKDIKDLTEALENNRELISQLSHRGVIGAEVLFIFPRDEAGASEYERWLHELLTGKLGAADDDELLSTVNLVLKDGPEIRKRLREIDTFRDRFQSEIWPKMVRVCGERANKFELFLDDPRIWDLLALADGEQLAKDWGLLPIDLLYGYPGEPQHKAYPDHLHQVVIEALLKGDNQTLNGLMAFRDEPLFHKLLERQLRPGVLASAINKLHTARPNHRKMLANFNRWPDKVLAEDVGPEPSGPKTWIPLYYTVWEVPKKLFQGRDPTGTDWFQAILDPALLVVDFVVPGEGEAIKITVKGAGKAAATGGTMAEKAVWTTLRNNALTLAERQVGKPVAEKMVGQQLVDFGVAAALSNSRQALRNSIAKATTVDVTKAMQFMFSYSGVGRRAFRAITGTEARLLMRPDARMFVSFSRLAAGVTGSRLAKFFDDSVKSLAVGAMVETKPGQDALHQVGKGVNSAADQLEAWRKNVSAWWLLNASGMGAVSQ